MADGKIIATYFKCELPNYGVFDEKRYFSPGQEAVVFELGGLKFGLNNCEDTWMDHSPAKAAQQGAQVLLALNASPFCTSKQYDHITRICATTPGTTSINMHTIRSHEHILIYSLSLLLQTHPHTWP